MKKVILILSITLGLASCGGSNQECCEKPAVDSVATDSVTVVGDTMSVSIVADTVNVATDTTKK